MNPNFTKWTEPEIEQFSREITKLLNGTGAGPQIGWTIQIFPIADSGTIRILSNQPREIAEGVMRAVARDCVKQRIRP